MNFKFLSGSHFKTNQQIMLANSIRVYLNNFNMNIKFHQIHSKRFFLVQFETFGRHSEVRWHIKTTSETGRDCNK